MLITFSGLDGAGKSTLIQLLKATLEKQNGSVAVFHMNDHIGLYAYLRFLRDWILGSVSDANGRSIQKPNPSDYAYSPRQDGRLKVTALRLRESILWSKSLRRVVYLVDLFIFLFYRLYVEKVKKQVLIMDRYFYDRLVDVDDGSRWLVLRFLEVLTPTPTVPVFLDISPEESYARKGEYSVDYLSRRWTSYQKVLPWVRSSVVLPTGKDISTTIRTLEKVVSERMAAQ